MAENGKELSRRLNPAMKQFFQWHYREGEPIRRVKEMMDELSYYLGKISDYDFRADEDKWKYRGRLWNRTWSVKKYDRGLHQPIPGNVSHLPIWQTEDGDVGNWRAAALAVEDESYPTLPAAEQDTQTSSATGGFGFWKARESIQLERPLNDVGSQSSALTSASFTGTEFPYKSTVNRDRRQHQYHLLNTAEIAQWSNSVTAPFNNIHPPMLPYDDPVNGIQYRSQAYGEPYRPNYTAVPTLATCTTSDGQSSTDAAYTTNNRNPYPYEGRNAQHIQSPCSPISVNFGPTISHMHGYPCQPSHVHEQDFTYDMQNITLSAQSPPMQLNDQDLHSYEEDSTSQGHYGRGTFSDTKKWRC